MLKKIRKTKLGFTLIELLVVISIIGILSSVILTSLKNAKVKAKNTKFVQELKSLQNAMALYISQYRNLPGTYGGDYYNNASLNTALNALVTNKFIPKIPHHPDWPANSSPWGGPKMSYLEYRPPVSVSGTYAYERAYGCGAFTSMAELKKNGTGGVIQFYSRDPDSSGLKLDTINTNCYSGNYGIYCYSYSPTIPVNGYIKYCIPFN